jgi:hypothetical protein
VFVLRAFEDPDVMGPSDPIEHLRIVEIELALADLETIEKRRSQAQRQSKLDKTLGDELEALEAAYASLSDGRPLYRANLSAAIREQLAPYFLLTNRPVLAVANVGDGDLDTIPEVEARVRAEMNDAGANVEVIGMCVQLEAEAATIVDPDERAEMLEGFGLGEGALFRMVRSAYHLLGLRTFFTTGEKESRAWTFHAGSKAPECAGRIHGDFQRGFIKAEVIHWDDLLALGSWAKAKEVGKIRVEGKDYEFVDGDVTSSASTCDPVGRRASLGRGGRCTTTDAPDRQIGGRDRDVGQGELDGATIWSTVSSRQRCPTIVQTDRELRVSVRSPRGSRRNAHAPGTAHELNTAVISSLWKRPSWVLGLAPLRPPCGRDRARRHRRAEQCVASARTRRTLCQNSVRRISRRLTCAAGSEFPSSINLSTTGSIRSPHCATSSP